MNRNLKSFKQIIKTANPLVYLKARHLYKKNKKRRKWSNQNKTKKKKKANHWEKARVNYLGMFYLEALVNRKK